MTLDDAIEECVHQRFRRADDKLRDERQEMPPYTLQPGRGDCQHCTYDLVKNRLCVAYFPVKVRR